MASATIAGEPSAYAYDGIGNFTSVTGGAVTNTYAANELNQYEEVESNGATLEPTYTANGELASFGDWTYAYDALSRLTAAYSNGTLVVSNRYDHLGRRVQKIAPDGTHTFLYDGWRPVVETVAKPGGGTDRIEYYWGKDLSGTLDGAAGVGGLLYVKRNGVIYVPFGDAFGNVMGYWDEQGNVVAEYAYDAFGRAVAQSGALADTFTIRYSTKYYDAETGMYYYGKRYYLTALCRWLTRDPIQEDGGVNLYAHCKNAPIFVYDKDGCAYVAYRRLDSFVFKLIGIVWSPEMERKNRVWAHEHIFFEDGKSPRDVGYFDSGVHSDTMSGATWYIARFGLKDACLRKAVSMVKPLPYSLLGDRDNDIPQYNCQDYVEDVLNMYDAIMSNKVYYPKSTKFIGGRN